jgi:hypothetical protein
MMVVHLKVEEPSMLVRGVDDHVPAASSARARLVWMMRKDLIGGAIYRLVRQNAPTMLACPCNSSANVRLCECQCQVVRMIKV